MERIERILYHGKQMRLSYFYDRNFFFPLPDERMPSTDCKEKPIFPLRNCLKSVGKILKRSQVSIEIISPPDIYSNDYTLDLKSFDKFSVAIYIERERKISASSNGTTIHL